MTVWDAIQQKRAVRHYTDQPLSQEAVIRILNAGRRSQSSKNTQPWHFIAIRDRATLERLSQTGTYLSPVSRATLCVAFVTPNVAPEDANWIAFDVGQSAAYMQLAAQEMGIGSVLGAVHEPDKAREALGFPAEFRCDAVLSFGYATPEETSRPRNPQGRRPLDDIVHWDTW